MRSRPGNKHGEKYQRSSEARGNDLTTREAMSSDLVVCGGFFKDGPEHQVNEYTPHIVPYGTISSLKVINNTFVIFS